MNSTQQLVFNGIDGLEAEEFIFSVRQRAIAERKDEDEKWMAKFASSCFSRDALRWHARLDPTTRNDWNLLQEALLSRFGPVFKGIDGTECENFIHSLRRKIFDEGKEDDNRWIARFVATCVVGDALRWHATLDFEVRNNWELLQQAMLSRYSSSGVRRPVQIHYEVPAAAPVAAVAVAASEATVPATPVSSLKRGRVKVTSDNRALSGYLSRNLNGEGCAVVTQLQSEALILAYDPSEKVLRITNSAADHHTLGMRWTSSRPTFASGSFAAARLVGISGSSGSSMVISWPSHGTVHTSGWDISSDGDIKMPWLDARGNKIDLFLRVKNREKFIFLAASPSGYDGDSSRWPKATFVFEET